MIFAAKQELSWHRVSGAGSHTHAVDGSSKVQCDKYGRASEGQVGDSSIL